MSTTPTLRHFIHHLHDEGAKIIHMTGHMLHEKTFWGIVGIVALIAALFALLVLWGNGPQVEYQIHPYYLW